MVFPTTIQQTKIVIWATMITTLITAQKMFPLTVFHLTYDPKWLLSPWTLLSAHAPLLLLIRIRRTQNLLHNSRMNTLIKFFTMGSGVVLYYTLLYRSLGTVEYELGSVDWSLAFLGTMSVYLFCVFLVLFPGGNVRRPLVPLMVSDRVSGHVWFLPTWVVVAVVVLIAWYLLDRLDQKIVEEEHARSGDERGVTDKKKFSSIQD